MDVRGLFAGLGVLVLALLCVPIVPAAPAASTRRGRRRHEPRRRIDLPALLLWVALVLLLLCLAAPPVATIAMGSVASGRGYRLCPDPAGEHRPPLRWARASTGRCPVDWEDARRLMQ